MSRPWRIEFKDTVLSSNLQELPENDINTISILKAQDSQKQYSKETVNLWKHLKKTEGVCTFNEAVRDILHLRELHKQIDETVLKAYGWTDINLPHNFYEVDYLAGERPCTIHNFTRCQKRSPKTPAKTKPRNPRTGSESRPFHAKEKTKKKQKTDAPGQMKLF